MATSKAAASQTTTAEGPQARTPKTQAPETQEPKTRGPETQGPETQEPKTRGPETQGPETQGPRTRAAKAHPAPAGEPGAAEAAAALAEALEDGDILFVAADEVRAEAVAAALQAAAPEATVLHCPGSDALPGEAAPASPANVGRRVAALHRLSRLTREAARPRIALVTTGEACARLYPEPGAFEAAPPALAPGDAVDLPALAETLLDLGYIADERVDEPGEMALRGRVLDVFPADAPRPSRIEVDDGRVGSLRVYDPATQLSTEDVGHLALGRVSEPALGAGTALPEHLLGAVVIVEPRADERRRRFLALAADAESRRPGRAARDVADEARWQVALAGRSVAAPEPAGDAPPPRFVEARAPSRALAACAREAYAQGSRVALLGSPRDLRFLRGRLAKALRQTPQDAASWREVAAAKPGALLTLAMPAARGFRRGGVLAIAAADLLGSRAERGPAIEGADTRLFDLGDIGIGDVVVHEDHGIGIVEGLEPLPGAGEATGDAGGEAIVLRYADGGRRLVPVAEADRIWRYGSDADAVALDRLDGSSWLKRRGAIDAAVADSARRLTALAAERAGASAPVLEPDAAAFERFAAGFPFTETADQTRAIAAARADLASGRPMDRLVVGDVGYGKTEVALRAAAIAALSGVQVALAAPTTVLARQHLAEFTRRFEGTGIAVAGLSRLTGAAEKRRVRAGLEDGSIGVVVGTGAVAAKGIAYARLGLVIVDEEQRFGAADKERLRALGAGHVLTLSATPIPRTLQGALVGLRQLSVIATPPARRQPIRTAVGPFDPETLRAALLREKSRGGQSFVVVPRIEDIAPLAERLDALVPELALVVAHGKMPAEALDEAMVAFADGNGDVLLATNIIEAGLDVPRANTMAIWRADRFGLSQLHQLRGRVGRGARRGQVLLLTEPEARIAPATLKRLRTLQAFDRLGAGFAISARDLDMRGAGDLLGEAQAGHMKLIGIDLYQHLLAGALRLARGEDAERWTPELNLGAAGALPADWIPDDEVRVTLYARLARIESAEALAAFEAELEDRFGALPAPAAALVAGARLALGARAARIARIDAGPAAIAFTPRRDFAGDPSAAGLTEKDGRLILKEAIEAPGARLERIEAVLEALEV